MNAKKSNQSLSLADKRLENQRIDEEQRKKMEGKVVTV